MTCMPSRPASSRGMQAVLSVTTPTRRIGLLGTALEGGCTYNSSRARLALGRTRIAQASSPAKLDAHEGPEDHDRRRTRSPRGGHRLLRGTGRPPDRTDHPAHGAHAGEQARLPHGARALEAGRTAPPPPRV